MKLSNFLFVAVLVIYVTGCATQYKQAIKTLPKPRPLGEKITETKKPTGNITLKQALALALMQNPELAAFSLEIRALEAKKLQAALLPNPELAFDTENFGGTGSFQGAQSMESTVQLSQLIELGGKRIKRIRIADLEKNLAGWDYEKKRLDVLTDTTIAFIKVLASQERLILTEKIVGLAKQLHNTVSERIKAGKVSPVDKIKTGIALSTIRLAWERDKKSLIAAKVNLAAVWGSTTPVFKTVKGNLETIFPVPTIDKLANLIEKHPDIQRWSIEIEKQQAIVEYAVAERIPDLTLSGGVRKINDTDSSTFVLGVSIPLPFFNRNQGEILKSRYRLEKVKEEQRAAKLRVRNYLVKVYQALSTAFIEANAWKNQVLPGAQSAFDAVREGYQYGKFGLLDVLDAQRTFIEAKSTYLETLVAFHKGVADLERLIGIPLKSITNTSEKMKGNIK